MKIKPIGDRLLIEKMEAEEKTKSGIVLPGTAKEEQSIATVIAISDELTKDEKKKDIIKVGDQVIYSKYAGTEVKGADKEYYIVKWTDILAVIE
ncbi:MAG: co-chaperone GroES [Tissierellia bacterium]|nr:co-chaperone GroES [Tissierellia bacterium]